MQPHPLFFQWDGDAMIPVNPRAADRQYVVGERYRLGVEEERSANSHRHFFASIAEAWTNLPEEWAERFQSPEALRKYALIKAGFADERSIVCASKAEAQRVGAFIRPMDDFSIVVVHEATVKVFTAKSQSKKAMGKEDFQRSKQAVLEIVSGLVGVSSAELSKEAGRAA